MTTQTVNDSIINKIRKLLALGSKANPNENEREQALKKAMDMMAEHNMTMTHIDAAGNMEGKPTRQHEKIRVEPWAREVIRAACKLNYTSVYYTNTGHGYQPVFIGTPENIAVTLEIATWLMTSIRKEANAAYGAEFGSSKAGYRRSFCTGAAVRLWERAKEIYADRIRQEQQPSAVPGTSLMVVRNALERANEELKRGLGLGPIRGRQSSITSSAYGAGREYGNSVSLNRQITATSAKRIGTR